MKKGGVFTAVALDGSRDMFSIEMVGKRQKMVKKGRHHEYKVMESVTLFGPSRTEGIGIAHVNKELFSCLVKENNLDNL